MPRVEKEIRKKKSRKVTFSTSLIQGPTPFGFETKDSSAQGGDSFLTEKKEEIESKESNEESRTESSTNDPLFAKEARHKDGDLLAQVLAAPEKLDTKEEPKAYEEDWKKVGTEENVDMELKEDATLSNIHTNNQEDSQSKAVPGKELQVHCFTCEHRCEAEVSAQGGVAETQEKLLKRFERVTEESPKDQWKHMKDCQNSIENDISGFDHYKDGTGVEHVGVAEKYHGGIKDKGKCDAGWRNAIHSSPDETGSVQRLSSSPLKMQRSSSSQSGVRNPNKDKEHGDSDSTAKLSQIAFQIKGGRRWKLESVYGIIEGGDKREKAGIWALGGDCREKSPILSWPTPAHQESCINKKET
ncbi:hypothetical protein Bca52824_058606 [Brassica carinata]|uniref:Uncharacterized protein n=1 Tax=Brassica carinata TaxID=52824 RepID=A0A8X7UHE2_BRACI|nr:hypothetical protein Bca52824_058606 [Brassica carinata]